MSALTAPSQAGLLQIPPLPDDLQPLQQQDQLPTADKGKGAAVASLVTGEDKTVMVVQSTPTTLTTSSSVDGNDAPTIVQPTSARSLRGQSSRSFASRNKDSAGPTPGSSANPIIAPSDLDCYVRVGMVPASSGETAQQARARHNDNETRLAAFLTTMERNIASQDRLHREHVEELSLISKTVLVHSSTRCLTSLRGFS